jgi:Zn-finger nucleic acid-binding protein
VNDERDFDMHAWFREDELKECPFCQQKTAIPASEGLSICFNCEVVWIDDGEPRQL